MARNCALNLPSGLQEQQQKKESHLRVAFDIAEIESEVAMNSRHVIQHQKQEWHSVESRHQHLLAHNPSQKE